MSQAFEVEITRDGAWPTVWRWTVVILRDGIFNGSRHGQALTKDRARRAALKAKRSIERDDVSVVHP